MRVAISCLMTRSVRVLSLGHILNPHSNSITPIMKRMLFACVVLLIGAGSRASADTATHSVPVAKSYQIRNVKYADLLRPEDANNANGTRIVLYPAQPW